MALKEYVVTVTRFGHLRNRELVDKAAMEGRTIPPLVEYLEKGDKVKLDPAAASTKRAIDSGSIEEPGASEKREQDDLKRRMDELQAQQDALAAQAKSGS